MGRALSGLALLIFFIACSDKLPEGVAPARVMPELLFDIHLLDSRMSNMLPDSVRILRDPAYGAVFEKYGLDSAEFRQTMEYYMTRPSDLLAFYKVVQERMQKHIDAEQARIDEELRLRRHADSLLAVHARDSLMRLARYEQQRDQIKHLLFVHEADSTIDEPVPFDYEEYARRPYEELGAWKLYFIESFGTDSLMLDSVGIDSLRLDSLRVDSLRLDSIRLRSASPDSPPALKIRED